jgi:soluble lytic murein transglycosylase-like protein
MSIQRVNSQPVIGGAPEVKESVKAGSQRSGLSFQDIFAAALSDDEVTGGSERLDAANAKLLRLEMMRSALSLDSLPSTPAREAGRVETLLALFAEHGQRTASAPLNKRAAGCGGIAGSAVPKVVAASHSADDNCDKSLSAVIVRASRRYGVEEGLIKAVIKAESNFNPTAVSPVGARGLMQLMPGTANGLGVTDSFNPEQNVMAGTRFLKDLLNRYSGDIDKALAAYNWGPGNLDRGKGRLPLETRDYLVKVKKYYSEYCDS